MVSGKNGLLDLRKYMVRIKGHSTDSMITALIDKYAQTNDPIAVDFRKLVQLPGYPERATHLIHTYPAKLLAHIPYFFLSNNILSKPGHIVFDPFCGSGTVLLESILMGREAIGTDVNPLAVLISRVKTTALDIDGLSKAYSRLISRIPHISNLQIPDVVNINYWFYEPVKEKLLCLLDAIRKTRNPLYRDFFFICFSNCVRKVSLADPRISVPVRLREDQYSPGHWLYEKTKAHLEHLRQIDVLKEFDRIVKANFRRMDQLNRFKKGKNKAKAVAYDMRMGVCTSFVCGSLNDYIRPESVQLVITSPPYASAQKYIRASSLSLGWLGVCPAAELKHYDTASIGREHFHKKDCIECPTTGIKAADALLSEVHTINPLRASIASTYLNEMRIVLLSVATLLKNGGYLVMVLGNSHVCGREFDSVGYIRSILKELNFKTILVLVDDIRSRGLMTKRNKTAGMITREWVLVYRKGG